MNPPLTAETHKWLLTYLKYIQFTGKFYTWIISSKSLSYWVKVKKWFYILTCLYTQEHFFELEAWTMYMSILSCDEIKLFILKNEDKW